jgi:predicted dehydrogenase
MAPLNIGILGAARIADDGIVDPSKVLGHRLVAVAARDRSRAEEFAQQRGVEKAHETYADVIDDPDVEVVYNALVNSLHATWNRHALQAGKHVLSEKPFASSATEASLVRDVSRTAHGQTGPWSWPVGRPWTLVATCSTLPLRSVAGLREHRRL